MFGQTFSPADLGVVGFLVLLEGLLSADNAVVLALMVRHLPERLQKKALLYGLGGAFVFRFLAIVFASHILSLWWLQLIGALYLIWLPLKHFVFSRGHGGGNAVPKAGRGFWQTVVAVEVTDIAFAVDSVLVAVTTVRGQDKLWVVYTGAIMGVILLRFAAGMFIGLLRRYPSLEALAYALVGWAGVKLMTLAAHTYHEWHEKSGQGPALPIDVPAMPLPLFWGVMTTLVVVGGIYAWKNPAPIDPVPVSGGSVEPDGGNRENDAEAIHS